jgi:alpha-L-fucosidase
MAPHITIPEGPFAPTWESLSQYRPPAWYVDGKFGIFIHWGVYAVPAFGNEWYPRNMYQEGTAEFAHHRRTYGPQDQFGYKDFIPQFRAEAYDPDHWAGLFRQAGARFVVPVAEHHDGFAMYDTALSDWSAARMGPCRDLIGDLAAAVRRQGLTFGLSSHRAEHWWFFDGGTRFPADVTDPRYAGLYGPAQRQDTQPNEEFLDDWLARTCELVDRYQPQLVWFDWWIEQPAFAPYLRRFAAYYYNRAAQWERGVAINFKNQAFPATAAVYDIERGQLDDISPLFWQNDTSALRNSWGYVATRDYKDAGQIIGDLVDIVAKNGALLLNMGPRPDGTLPAEDEDLLRQIGAWLAVHGEAIYDSRPWKVYGEGPTQVGKGSFTDTQRQPFTAADIRYTRRGDVLYAILLGWPTGGEARLQSLGSELRLYPGAVGRISLLGHGEALRWTRTRAGVRVRLPEAPPGGHAWVLKIEPAR